MSLQQQINSIGLIRAIFRHKWLVLVAGWKLDIPIIRLIFHDLSLFLPGHFRILRNYVKRRQLSYHNLKEQALITDIDRKYYFHINRRPHHWQYWVLIGDDGTVTAQYIPEDDTDEMIADWMAYAREKTGEWDPYAYIDAQKNIFIIHPDTWNYIHTKLFNYGYISKHTPFQEENQCGVVDAMTISVETTGQCLGCDTSCCAHCSTVRPNITIRQKVS